MHRLNQLTIEAERQRQSGENMRDCNEICDALGSQASALTCAGLSGWVSLILIDLSQVTDVVVSDRRWASEILPYRTRHWRPCEYFKLELIN
jgi:hypothetical protein